MASKCPLCEKGTRSVWKLIKLRGKYNPTVKRRKKPNLQWVRLPARHSLSEGGASGKRIRACANCIKSLAKQKS